MSEVAEAPVQAQASAGTLLRRAREASGLHVAALAVALKVPVRKLEALEDDRYEDVGDAVFIRALASSVCRNLKVDAQQILERLPQTTAPRLGRDSLNAPFRGPGDAPAPSWVDALRQPVPLAVLTLLVGAAVIYLLPVSHTSEEKAIAAPAAAPTLVPAAAPAPTPVAEQPVPIGAPAAADASASASKAAPVAPATPVQAAALPATQATLPALQAPAAASASAPGAASASSPSAPPPAGSIVVLRTRGESWVEVVDAKGVVALRKLMTSGEAAGAAGALPLTVTIGKVDLTEVEVRGRKFDLKPVSKDNVARFEVK